MGSEEGKSEIYVMSAQGGKAKLLNIMGGKDVTTARWNKDKQIIFVNNAEHWYLRSTFLYTVDLDGNSPIKLDYGPARSIDFGPQGGILLGRNHDDPARWKRYRGGTTGQIWVDLEGNGEFTRILSDLKTNLTSPMWLANGDGTGRIYLTSDHEGISNLYSCEPDGKDLQRHCEHTDFYVRNATNDGSRIVYHDGGERYTYDLKTKQV